MPKENLSNPVNMEKVDSCMEDTLNCLSNLNEKMKVQSILNEIIVKTDKYIEIEQNGDKYYIKVNGDKLNISLDIKQLEELGPILIKLLNTDIQLFGYKFDRTIAEDSLWLDGLEDKYIEFSKSNLSKNDIEELFVFIMKVKGIPMEEWKIEPTICANSKVNKACKQALGNKKGS